MKEDFTLILVFFRKCKSSKFFSRYREKRPKMTIFEGQNRPKIGLNRAQIEFVTKYA